MADFPALAGPNGNRISLIIILAVGVAVTSVPVVSKIFADLKILHTRFARLVLGVAVLEDIVLWLALALATAMAGKSVLNPKQMSYHLISTVVFFGLGLTIVPRIIKHINKSRFNVFAQQSPVAYALAVLLAYCVVAGALDVSLVFAAFLAGFAVVHKKRKLFAEALDAIGKVSFAFFIPVYFAIVGLKLDLIRGFALWMVVAFVLGSCLVKILSVSLAGRFAGFRGLDLVNLAITTNARGGPGIVLASVAFDAGIISAQFYTTLVLAAVLTSQAAGAWLDYVLRKGWPLLVPLAIEEVVFPAKGRRLPELVLLRFLELPQKSRVKLGCAFPHANARLMVLQTNISRPMFKIEEMQEFQERAQEKPASMASRTSFSLFQEECGDGQCGTSKNLRCILHFYQMTKPSMKNLCSFPTTLYRSISSYILFNAAER